jgi:hypothetical protein
MSLSRRTTAVLTAVGTAAAAVTAALLTGGSPAGAAPGTPGCSATPSYDYTIPAPQGPPAAAPLSDGTVGFAIAGADAKTYFTATDINADTLQVSPLYCFGGAAVDNPSLVEFESGLGFFVRGSNGVIYLTDATPNGSGWAKVPNGTAGGGPAAVLGADGRINLFIRGTNGALYQAVRSLSGSWGPFRSLGGSIEGTPAVARRPGGGLIAVIKAPTGYLYTRSSNTAGSWGAWTRVAGTAATSPAITAGFAANRLDLFVIGQTGGLYQSTFASGRFGTFKKIESTVTAATRLAAAASPGRLIVYITEVSGPGDASTAYTQYLPGGWTGTRHPGEPYVLAPYTWPDGAPSAAQVAAQTDGAQTDGAKKRPAPSASLR